MQIIDIVKRAGRSLKSAKLRTLLTSMAIAVGGFTLTLTLGAGTGANLYAKKIVQSNFDPSELIIAKDSQLFGNNNSTAPQEYDDTITSIQGGGNSNFQVKRLTPADVDDIRSTPGIETVRENYQVNIRYISRSESDKKFTGSANAYNPAQKPELKAGILPRYGDIEKGSILLPLEYLESLGFADADQAIGQTVILNIQRPFSLESAKALFAQAQAAQAAQVANPEQPAPELVIPITAAQSAQGFESQLTTLKVVGVTKKAATSLQFGTSPLLISSVDAKELNEYTTKDTPNFQKFVLVYARVKEGATKVKRDVVQKALKDKGYNVQSVEDTQKVLTQFVNILQSIVLVFGVITLIASVFGVINTQYISVLERTREIGLMKALGMRGKDIRRLFTIEATWIGFLGGVTGVIAGLIVGTLGNPILSKKLDLGAGNNLIVFRWYQLVILILVLMWVTYVAGALPARKAAKLDPIEALRTE